MLGSPSPRTRLRRTPAARDLPPRRAPRRKCTTEPCPPPALDGQTRQPSTSRLRPIGTTRPRSRIIDVRRARDGRRPTPPRGIGRDALLDQRRLDQRQRDDTGSDQPDRAIGYARSARRARVSGGSERTASPTGAIASDAAPSARPGGLGVDHRHPQPPQLIDVSPGGRRRRRARPPAPRGGGTARRRSARSPPPGSPRRERLRPRASSWSPAAPQGDRPGEPPTFGRRRRAARPGNSGASSPADGESSSEARRPRYWPGSIQAAPRR